MITNRKSHMRFRLVPKSTTLDDLEGPLRTLFQNTCIFGANHDNLNDDRPILWRRRCSPMTIDSGSIGICGYSRGFTGEGASNNSGVIENVDDFRADRTLRLRHLRK